MHAIVKVITKHPERIGQVMDLYTWDEDEGNVDAWFDYWTVGGRYDGLLLVTPQTKPLIGASCFECAGRRLYYTAPDGKTYRRTNGARIRNIKMGVLLQATELAGELVERPYIYVLDLGDEPEDAVLETCENLFERNEINEQIAWMREQIEHPKPEWSVIIVDVHM